MAATCAGLRDSQEKQAVNLGWLLLVLCLESLSTGYRGWGLTEAGYCLSDRIWEVVKHEPRPNIHMEKPLLTAWVGS